jgi:hypothetical protein
MSTAVPAIRQQAALLSLVDLREGLRDALADVEDAAKDARLWLGALEDSIGLPLARGTRDRPLPSAYEPARSASALSVPAPATATEFQQEQHRALATHVLELVATVVAATVHTQALYERVEAKLRSGAG